ncbi:unnamed protein product [Thelazia callipaeda]|uniref:Uncharacterized protein n=1 Tax=Thelazia callipaeda TaxID=103827 RepID=A0A0N5D2B4_THECL|nr:unnamed protein product [Thelazia callipaeda]
MLSLNTICIVSILYITAVAKRIQIVLRQNVTRFCPGHRERTDFTSEQFELIDGKTMNVHFELVSIVSGADHFLITGQNGNTLMVSFPGCFRVRLNLQFKKVIRNPYIESFIQLGTNIPCKADEYEINSDVHRICTNISQDNWCPPSANQKLQSMLTEKSTCRFCNLCPSLKSNDENTESYITNEETDECDSAKLLRTFSFKICTPPLQQLRGKDELNGKLEEYWSYLKQGVITAVVHILDRPNLEETRLKHCERLCMIHENRPTISESYQKTLLRSIQTFCVPNDSYAACIYHTMKFNVIDN